jgi:maleamate amidohydrolase
VSRVSGRVGANGRAAAASTNAEDASEIYARQGLGGRSGLGERPALLVVDFTNAFADPARFGGGNIASAITNTRRLLAAARRAALPIAFTRVVYAADGSDAGVFTRKAPGLLDLTEDAEGSQVVPELAPLAGEHVIRKTQPSAFFGTDLAGWLLGRGVDTVLVTGATTSGCVRASVVDAMSYNLRTVVVRDGVGDRALAPHEANLFDMEQKYADLLTATEAMAAIRRIARRAGASRTSGQPATRTRARRTTR